MKKFLTVALLTLYAMSAQSRESITIGDYLFTYSPAESNAWARNYVGNDSHAVVPSSISFMTEMRDSHGYVIYDDDGKPRKIFHHYDVTEAYSTFIRKKVTEVILPSSIKRLQYTFYECSSLTSVDLGAVEVIDGSTFWECTSLASIEIPSTVKIIGDNAFNSCSSLSSIIIPSSVTNIGYDAFIDCDALTSIETPSSLKFLGSGCFRYCASLKSAEINGTDLAVEVGTFLECPNLETAILGSGITSIADGSTTSGYETGMFAYCTSLKSVAINTTSVMKLPIAMFYRSSVQTVSVAGGFAEIGKGAFYRCTSLEAIEGNLVPITIGDHAFYKCSKFKSGVDFSRCEAISGWAFYECSSLTNVRFGPNLSSIGSNAFYGCSKLELVEFDGAPPSVGSGAFSRVKSGAVGTYTAEHAAEWEAVIDSKGYWNGLKMKPSYYTVIYDANNGTGARTTATVEWGEPTPAGNGTFTWEAHYFMGWAFAPDSGSSLGSDDVIPEPQEGNTVTLYGQWATFEPVAADWGTGSITLKATGVSLKEGEEFFLSYCDASAAESDGAQWDYVEDYILTSDGTGVSFTDTQFSSRLGGIPALRYRLQIGKSKDDVRARLYCTTRNRFLLSVGYDAYKKVLGLVPWVRPLKQSLSDAVELKQLCVGRGDFPVDNVTLLSNSQATVQDIRDTIDNFASRTKSGDLFVFYIATHGGDYSIDEPAHICAYDAPYYVNTLQTDVRKFSSGVAVVCVIMSCHSQLMVAGAAPTETIQSRINTWLTKCGFAQCLGNVAWIASCAGSENSYNSRDYTMFGQSFIHDGFMGGYADAELYGVEFDGVSYDGGNSDGIITFGELGRYACAFAKGISDDDPSDVKLENMSLLDRIGIGKSVIVSHMNKPEPPTDVTASQGVFDMRVKVDWHDSNTATSYRVYRYPVSSPGEFKWVGRSFSSSWNDDTARVKEEYAYRVQAINPVGVSELSYVATGSRGSYSYLSYLGNLLGATSVSITLADYDAKEKTIAANGCRTVGECYALGIDPEDLNDDLKITDFRMEDGKPIITLNHTKDGSGNSFESRIKTLGKANLTDEDWVDVTDKDQSPYRFFKVTVDMP